MKHLKLFFALFAMLALGVGNAWAEEVTETIKMKGFAGLSSSGYQNVTKTGTSDAGTTMVAYAFNPGTGQVRGNKTTVAGASVTSEDKNKNWSLYNSQAMGGAIKAIKVTQTATGTNIFQNNLFVSLGTSSQGEVTNVTNAQIQDAGGTAQEINFSIDPSKGYTYFKLLSNQQFAKGTIANVVVTVTYETSGGGEPEPPVVTIELDRTEATLNLEETLTLNATVENSEETIVWASDKESVATVSNGVVTAIGAGKANITATVEDVTATCVVTVKDPNAPAWTLVTNASTLKAGDKIVIAGTGDNSNYALSTEQKSNNRGAVAATKTDDKIEEVDNMQILTLETGTKTGAFAFNTGSGYLYAASSSSNHLKTQTTNNDNGSWTIAIADGVATVVAQGANTHNTMRYNYNNGSPLFAAYLSSSTTGALVAIYTQAKPAGTPDAPTLTASQEFETETFTVEISAVDGATIHYTLGGSDPTEASTTYSAPFTVNATTTVKAIAVKDGVASNVATATYTKVSVIEKTCAEAAALCTSDESIDKYRVEGYVTAIETAYSAQYNNITVWMADTRNGGNVLQAFRATPTVEADKAVKVGDQIEVVGKLKLYNSVPEIVSGTYTITQLDPVYNVNITSEHGTVTATPASAVEGTEITLSVEVETGWVFQSWTVTADASSNPIEVVNNKFTMPASDVTVVANYTESVADDAVLTLMANGNQHSQETYKVGETVELPETIDNNCVKQFVGWSTEEIEESLPEKPTSKFYEPGADFTLTAEGHILYAVYATAAEGELTSIFSETFDACNGTGGNDGKWSGNVVAQGDLPDELSSTWTFIKGTKANECAKFGTGSVKGSAQTPVITLNGDATLTFKAAAWSGDGKTLNLSATGATLGESSVTLKEAEWTEYTVAIKGATGSVNIKFEAKNASDNRFFLDDVVVSQGSITYSDYSTTCAVALDAPEFSVAAGTYNAAQTVTITAEDGATIYYTLDGNNPTSASDVYSEAIVLDECGEFTIKAIAIGTESESPVASATYTINLPITNTEATAYTPAEAIAIIDGACDKTEEVYVKGVVVSTSGLNTEYGNYDKVVVKAVDDESATPTEFTFFRLFKDADKIEFTTSDEVIGVGDIITAKGKLTKYYSTYELAEGCYLVSRVANAKLDAELAWDPETVTITVDEEFAAPTLSNPHSVSGITYESSNDEVATVSAAGVIALVDGAVGTATITAKFSGDDSYKAAEVSCTIKVKAIPEDCEGSDDFATDESENPLSYLERTTAAGWKATNAARVTIEDETYFAINGKTSTVGTITSPELNGGIGSIKIRYANTYKEDNGVSFQLDIKQNDEVVKTYTVTKVNADVIEDVVYTELIEDINVEGDFVMVFTNLHPSNNSEKNKDRVSIGRLCWTGYEIPTYTITTTATNGSAKGDGVYKEGEKVTLTADPAIDYTFVNWTVGGAEVSTANPYVFTASADLELVANFRAIPERTTDLDLTGTFSVGLYEVAQFATGNLQYKKEGENETWRFAKQQYQYVGEANINVGDPAFEGWIDMFGWSTNETTYGVDPRNLNELYDGEFVDWGNLFPVEDNWSTLSADQWKYLLNTRAKAKDLKQIARVGSVVGIMLFPDNWNETLVVDAEYDSYYELYMYNYSITQWTTLEAKGALFLPAAGRRTGGYGNMINYDQETEAREDYLVNGGFYRWQDNTNIYCYYWTSTINETTKNVSYLHNMVDLGNDEYTIGTGAVWGEKGRYGQSVRLAKVTDVTPETYTRPVTNGEWGTICLPYASSSVTGATFYEVSSLVYGEGLWLDQLADGDQLVAGKPYIFQATATEIAVTYTGEAVGIPIAGVNGLTGTFTNIAAGGLTGNYIIAENKVWVAGSGATLPANRAYIANTVPTTPQAQIPGRRRVCMGENQTTGLDNITNGENTTIKVIENGQLIIIRNGEKFNAQGQRL